MQLTHQLVTFKKLNNICETSHLSLKKSRIPLYAISKRMQISPSPTVPTKLNTIHWTLF